MNSGGTPIPRLPHITNRNGDGRLRPRAVKWSLHLILVFALGVAGLVASPRSQAEEIDGVEPVEEPVVDAPAEPEPEVETDAEEDPIVDAWTEPELEIDGVEAAEDALVLDGSVVDPLPLPTAVGGEGGGVTAGGSPAVETQVSGNNYVLLDSNDPGGPTDSLGCVTPWSALILNNPAGSDGGEFDASLPFPFEFYGSTYNDITIGVNGGIRMGAGAGDVALANSSLTVNPHAGIYPFWDNLDFDVLDFFHSIYACTVGVSPNRVYKVIWYNVDCVGCAAVEGETASFEVGFHEADDAITFHYHDTAFSFLSGREDGASATIGIDSGVGGHLEYSFDQDSIVANPFTVRFWVPDCGGHVADIVGTRASETIYGTAGNDVIAAHLGDDIVHGYQGIDTICGEAGADKLFGGPDSDTIYGGDGPDRIRGGGASDFLLGGNGNDTIDGGGGPDTISGGLGDDDLSGRGAADHVIGGPGEDTLAGNEGGDTLDGGDNADTAVGNTGPDMIEGGPGHDTLRGGEGNDTLIGNGGNDLCAGNTGPADEAHAATCERTPGVEVLY